jgi:hypothetical protein
VNPRSRPMAALTAIAFISKIAHYGLFQRTNGWLKVASH